MAWQEQEGMPPLSRHSAYGPHGEGMHGLTIVSGVNRGSENFNYDFLS